MLQEEIAAESESKSDYQQSQTAIIYEKQQKITELEKQMKVTSNQNRDFSEKMGL